MGDRLLALSLLYLFLDSTTACGLLNNAGLFSLVDDQPYPVLPGPVTTANNAFVTNDLQRPLRLLSGNDKPLLENLNDYFANSGESMCYWAFQGLPPPRRDTMANPYDVSDGYADQDIEWVQAYGEVAVSRLHSRIKKDGPVVGAMCSMGAVIAKRRCANKRSAEWKCIDAITNGTVQWPMAVSIWKIGHPDLHAAVGEWRASTYTGHAPNIAWVTHLPGSEAARPWTGPMPKPGEIHPSSMPKNWKQSQLGNPFGGVPGWGTPKIAKVVKCSDIPAKFYYNTEELFFCDHMPDNSTSAPVSSVDEAYAAWRSLEGLWPPTKPCEDNLVVLNATMAMLVPQLMGADCKTVYEALRTALPNYDCDNSDVVDSVGLGSFRSMCCSVCGGNVPVVPTPSPPPVKQSYQCLLCNHVYDAEKDGNGTAFEDLPESWRCPHCGAPKKAYFQNSIGEWVHSYV